MSRRIFVSHASLDGDVAKRICSALEKRQLHCWLAVRDIGPGQNFQEAITRAIKSAVALVLVFSQNTNDSNEVKKELALASQHQIPVFPVRIARVWPNDALAYEFATRQWIDLIDDFDGGLERLASHVAATDTAPSAVKQRVEPEVSMRELLDKPSVAVLPFENISASADQDFFSEGLAQDILTELSKFRWLFVTARNSSFTLAKKDVDAKHASQELGVRYILQGTVRRSGSRIRVSAQLVDGPSGAHLWAERYDRSLIDIFTVQDEITKAVATAIAPAIVDAERQRAVRKLPQSLDAWEAYQRGLWHISKHDPQANETAREFFRRAIELDENFAAAYSGVALTYSMAGTVFSSMSYADGNKLNEEFARKAVELDPNDADCHSRLAGSLFAAGHHEAAIEEADLAISLNSNCAEAIGIKGAALAFSGRGEQGRETLGAFFTMSPRDPTLPVRMSQLAISYYFDRDYRRSAEVAQQVIRRFPKNPAPYRTLASALGQLGEEGEAAAALRTLQELAPLPIDQFLNQRRLIFRPADYDHILEGLRKAGLTIH